MLDYFMQLYRFNIIKVDVIDIIIENINERQYPIWDKEIKDFLTIRNQRDL